MWTIVTGRIVWSVCCLVGLSQSWAVQKRLNRLRCRLRCGHGWAQGTLYWMGSRSPHGKGKFWGGKPKTLSDWQMAGSGWKSNINNFSITESELWINTGPSTFQLQETMLKSDKVWCTYLVINCQFTNFSNAPCILCVYSLNLNQRRGEYRSSLNWKFGQMMWYCGGVLPRTGNSINDLGEIWRGRLYCENHLARQI